VATFLPQQRIGVDDRQVRQLATLQVKVRVPEDQMADSDMANVLGLFRRRRARFIRTLKENLLWVRTFDTIEELRAALVKFAMDAVRDNRHGHRDAVQKPRTTSRWHHAA
jgi:hypothetical protein